MDSNSSAEEREDAAAERRSAVAMASAMQPHPFVRRVRDFMDNCAGTNKSQYTFGALALLLLKGELDTLFIDYMVPGDTKFDSDVCAQKTAGKFNSRGCFNHGMLNEMFSAHVTARAYNLEQMQHFKPCTTVLFQPVNHITQFRSFLLVGDDGNLDGDPGSSADPPTAFPDENGVTFYDAASVETACKMLEERSLVRILPIALEATNYRGIGDGTGLYGQPATTQAFPFRRVRLFKRLTECGAVWAEQTGYHVKQQRGDAEIRAALAKIVTFADLDKDVLGGMGKPLYGNKEKQIKEQFGRYVPPQDVPARYDLGENGMSGRLSASACALLRSDEDNERQQRLAEERKRREQEKAEAAAKKKAAAAAKKQQEKEEKAAAAAARKEAKRAAETALQDTDANNNNNDNDNDNNNNNNNNNNNAPARKQPRLDRLSSEETAKLLAACDGNQPDKAGTTRIAKELRPELPTDDFRRFRGMVNYKIKNFIDSGQLTAI